MDTTYDDQSSAAPFPPFVLLNSSLVRTPSCSRSAELLVSSLMVRAPAESSSKPRPLDPIAATSALRSSSSPVFVTAYVPSSTPTWHPYLHLRPNQREWETESGVSSKRNPKHLQRACIRASRRNSTMSLGPPTTLSCVRFSVGRALTLLTPGSTPSPLRFASNT